MNVKRIALVAWAIAWILIFWQMTRDGSNPHSGAIVWLLIFGMPGTLLLDIWPKLVALPDPVFFVIVVGMSYVFWFILVPLGLSLTSRAFMWAGKSGK